jgi:hypothetical protein
VAKAYRVERRGVFLRFLLELEVMDPATAVEVVKSDSATDSSSSLRMRAPEGESGAICGSRNLTERSLLCTVISDCVRRH